MGTDSALGSEFRVTSTGVGTTIEGRLCLEAPA
jgi:hypothetical protein